MKTDYDVLIIGSGASGGMAAHTLTKLGVKCLMLDAGPAFDFNTDRSLRAVYDLPYRGFGKPGQFPHVTQANEGCDLDFLETGDAKPVPEPDIY